MKSAPLFPQPKREMISQVVPAWRLDEKRAMRFAADKTNIRKMLDATIKRGALDPEEREKFKEARWEPNANALVGADGFVLTWRIRLKPEEPPSCGNEQTPVGVCILVRLPAR